MELLFSILVGCLAIYAEFWLWSLWQAAKEYAEYHRWDQTSTGSFGRVL